MSASPAAISDRADRSTRRCGSRDVRGGSALIGGKRLAVLDGVLAIDFDDLRARVDAEATEARARDVENHDPAFDQAGAHGRLGVDIQLARWIHVGVAVGKLCAKTGQLQEYSCVVLVASTFGIHAMYRPSQFSATSFSGKPKLYFTSDQNFDRPAISR